MKLNISFSSFKKNHKSKKDQLIYRIKNCKDYKQVENIFNFLLVKKNSFIFESVEKGSIRGRYTIIGLNPDKEWNISKNNITVKYDGKKKVIKGKPLNFLNNLINKFNTKIPKGLPKMAAMLVGYFSYDVIRYIENIPDKCIDDLKIPDVRIIRPNNLIIYDNLRKKIYFIENIFAETKIKNLFDSCVDTYRKLKKIDQRVSPMVSVTVSHENCENIENIFNYLTKDCKIDSLKCTIVRDEGVYKTPQEKREKIFKAYTWLTNKIQEMTKQKKMNNYNSKSLQGKLHSKKDEISWKLVKEMYLIPKYISPCHAGGLFGIISSAGLVYPCEILEDKLLGDLRKNQMDFMKIWRNQATHDVKKFISKSNCNCTYECALTYNILGNWRYQPNLISSIFY